MKKTNAYRSPILASLLAALVLLFASALPGYAQQPVTKQANGPIRDAATGITFPASLGGMQLVSVTDYEVAQRGLGFSYRYRDPSDPFNLDVYVYNQGRDIPTGTDAAIMVQQVEAALADVRTVAAQGVYQNVTITDTTQTCRFSGVQFRCVTLRFEVKGRPVQSLLLLRGERGNFVKVRATWASDDVKAAASVQNWVAAFAALLKP